MPLNGTALVITVGNIAAAVQILKSSQASISNVGKTGRIGLDSSTQECRVTSKEYLHNNVLRR
jgi:hypothetical protein